MNTFIYTYGAKNDDFDRQGLHCINPVLPALPIPKIGLLAGSESNRLEAAKRN